MVLAPPLRWGPSPTQVLGFAPLAPLPGYLTAVFSFNSLCTARQNRLHAWITMPAQILLQARFWLGEEAASALQSRRLPA
jgi:hypothetical protein